MIWIVIILIIVGVIIVRFAIAVNKDNSELNKEPLDKKFNALFHELINEIYQGNGKVRIIDERALNLYSDGALQIVQVFYSTGHITLTWRKRDFRRGELVFEKQYNNVRDLSYPQQRELAQSFVKEGLKYFYR